jgi:hypothetical protein
VRAREPFQPEDLRELGELYSTTMLVVPMEDVFDGVTPSDVIGLRHDCDNVIAPAVQMAEWEWERGYRSTYYILHTSPYWQEKDTLRAALETIASCGHEIGIHNDAITVALETGRKPADVLFEAIEELRGYGHEIRSTVAHGNKLCRVHNYVNDEMFEECFRRDYGNLWWRFKFDTTPLAEFGLDFDANWLPRGDYLSDSGGQWSQSFEEVAAAFPSRGQLHMLVHPDWWAQAFTPAEVTA